ncbi:MAG: hypothetical protein LBE46_02630 [Wolbachia pipientis]|nr:hypothetical protein [Wolbachia pipientis]
MAKRAQERCHSSAPFFVIPVPRHWDPEKLIVNKRTIQHFRSKAGLQTGMTS